MRSVPAGSSNSGPWTLELALEQLIVVGVALSLPTILRKTSGEVRLVSGPFQTSSALAVVSGRFSAMTFLSADVAAGSCCQLRSPCRSAQESARRAEAVRGGVEALRAAEAVAPGGRPVSTELILGDAEDLVGLVPGADDAGVGQQVQPADGLLVAVGSPAGPGRTG
jgi:hypothetical protein